MADPVKIADLNKETSFSDDDSFVFSDSSAGLDKRIEGADMRKNISADIENITALKLFEGTRDGQTIELLGYHERGDGGGGTLYWDATSTEDDNGGTIFQVTGVTTGRWKRPKKDVINIKIFGAKGDGVTDDTTAIQSAIDSGFGIFVPNATFVINSQINIPSNTFLFGVGEQSVFKAGTGFTGDFTEYMIAGDSVSNVTISNIRILQNDEGISLNEMIRFVNSSKIIITNNTFGSVWHSTNTFTEQGQNKLQHQTNHAVTFVESEESIITGCHVEEGFRVAYRLEDYCHYNKIIDNWATNVHRGLMINTRYGDYDPVHTNFIGDTATEQQVYDAGGSHHNIVSGNHFERCRSVALKIERGSWYNTVSNNQIKDCCETANDSGGGIVTGGWYNKIINNTFRNPTMKSDGTSIADITVLSADSRDVEISGNTISKSNVRGISVGGCIRIKIHDNKIKEVLNEGRAIVISTATDLEITKNYIKDVAFGITLTAEITGYKIDDNEIKDVSAFGIIGDNTSSVKGRVRRNRIEEIGQTGIRLSASSDIIIEGNDIVNVNKDAGTKWSILAKSISDLIIRGNKLLNPATTPTASIRTESVNGALIESNEFYEGVDLVTATGHNFRRNIGYVSENSGSNELISGNTSITVTHGLDITPSANDIAVTPRGSLGSANSFWITDVGATSFNIRVNVDPAQNINFGWSISRIQG